MRVSTMLGAGGLGVLAFLVLTSKTGGVTFESNSSIPIEVGGTTAKPSQMTHTNHEVLEVKRGCPPVTISLPPHTDTVILGDTHALIIDTEGKETLSTTDCVDLNTAHISYCDNKANCREGMLANGNLQAKPTP